MVDINTSPCLDQKFSMIVKGGPDKLSQLSHRSKIEHLTDIDLYLQKLYILLRKLITQSCSWQWTRVMRRLTIHSHLARPICRKPWFILSNTQEDPYCCGNAYYPYNYSDAWTMQRWLIGNLKRISKRLLYATYHTFPLVSTVWRKMVTISFHECFWQFALCRRSSNYIFVFDIIPGINSFGKDNCKTRRETLKIWVLVRLTLDI